MQRRQYLQLGGTALGAALVGGVAAGRGQTATDTFEPLGSVDVPGAADAAVHHDDTVAYVAAEDGFAAVDISEPESPELIAQRREIETGTDRPLRLVWDLWPWENRLVVGGPAQIDSGSTYGFALFDISDPSEPEQIAFHRTDTTEGGPPHYIHNSYFEDGIVYLTGSGIPEHPLVMVDVSDDEPEEVGRWSIIDYDSSLSDIPFRMRPLHDVYVQDEIAYLPYWDAGTWIVDVSDPADPSVRSRVGDYELDELRAFESTDAEVEAFVPPGNAHYAQVNEDGSILVVGKEAWAVEDGDETVGGAGGVDLYDVSDESNPEHLSRIEAAESFGQTREEWFTTAHNCDIVGDRLYTSWYFGGVKIHDVSDPTAPEEIAWWRNPLDTSFWTAQSAGDVFVASSANVSQKIRSDELNETREALYVFPDRAGTQEDPPSLLDPPEELFGEQGQNQGEESDDTDRGETDEGNGSTGEGSTASPEETDDTDGGDGEDADAFGPGFGVGGAAAGIAGYYLYDSYRADRQE